MDMFAIGLSLFVFQAIAVIGSIYLAYHPMRELGRSL